MASQFKETQPKEYYRKFLEKDCRPDGRKLCEFRHTTLTPGLISSAEGSSLVKVGDTIVICGVKAEVGKPTELHPDQGIIIPNIELSPLCSSRLKMSSEEVECLCTTLSDLLKNSKCIDFASLCIVSQKYCWILYCDMYCLSLNGNLFDALVQSLVSALYNVKLPLVVFNEETEALEIDPKSTWSLTIPRIPVACSFATVDQTVLLVDPDAEEEAISDSILTVIALDDGQLCGFYKSGGSPATPDMLDRCMKRAHARGNEVRAQIRQSPSSNKR